MCASDRMSRPKVALPLPSPPTAPQVMMGEVAYGICLSKNLHEYGGRCKWAGWALREADGVWDILFDRV